MAMSAEPMNAGQVVRDRRIHARLTGLLVSARSGVGRSRLSDIERGYIIPRAEELVRINAAIDSLNEARRAMERTASEVGWPAGAI
jgi:transcriptional regulator with XRE-family HTH domain